MITRREILKSGLVAASMLTLPKGLVAAESKNRGILVLIRLAGGFDGFSFVNPVGNKDFGTLRSRLAIKDGIPLTDGWVMHKDGAPLLRLWSEKSLAIAPAVIPVGGIGANPVDAAAAFMAGRNDGMTADGGWLGRILEFAGKDTGQAIAGADGDALIVRPKPGSQSFRNLLPSPPSLPGFLAKARVALSDNGGEAALLLARDEAAIPSSAADGSLDYAAAPAAAYRLARALASNPAPSIGYMDMSGWDTGTAGTASPEGMSARIYALATAIDILASTLKKRWADCAIIATSETGRSLVSNGNGGTDIGGPSGCLIAGGKVSGGRLLAPPTSFTPKALESGRYPKAEVAQLSILKAAVASTFGFDRKTLDDHIFPGSTKTPALNGLFK